MVYVQIGINMSQEVSDKEKKDKAKVEESQTKNKTQDTPPTKMDPPASGPLEQLETWLYEMLVVKAPFQLPVNVKDWIVKYSPWITLALTALLLPALIGLFRLLSSPYLGGILRIRLGALYYTSLAILVIQVGVMVASIPMLIKRRRLGWNLVFYGNIVNIIYAIVSAFRYGFDLGGLLGNLIGSVIGFYFLFQIRSYYTAK